MKWIIKFEVFWAEPDHNLIGPTKFENTSGYNIPIITQYRPNSDLSRNLKAESSTADLEEWWHESYLFLKWVWQKIVGPLAGKSVLIVANHRLADNWPNNHLSLQNPFTRFCFFLFPYGWRMVCITLITTSLSLTPTSLKFQAKQTGKKLYIIKHNLPQKQLDHEW